VQHQKRNIEECRPSGFVAQETKDQAEHIGIKMGNRKTNASIGKTSKCGLRRGSAKFKEKRRQRVTKGHNAQLCNLEQRKPNKARLGKEE